MRPLKTHRLFCLHFWCFQLRLWKIWGISSDDLYRNVLLFSTQVLFLTHYLLNSFLLSTFPVCPYYYVFVYLVLYTFHLFIKTSISSWSLATRSTVSPFPLPSVVITRVSFLFWTYDANTSHSWHLTFQPKATIPYDTVILYHNYPKTSRERMLPIRSPR